MMLAAGRASPARRMWLPRPSRIRRLLRRPAATECGTSCVWRPDSAATREADAAARDRRSHRQHWLSCQPHRGKLCEAAPGARPGRRVGHDSWHRLRDDSRQRFGPRAQSHRGYRRQAHGAVLRTHGIASRRVAVFWRHGFPHLQQTSPWPGVASWAWSTPPGLARNLDLTVSQRNGRIPLGGRETPGGLGATSCAARPSARRVEKRRRFLVCAVTAGDS
jgi:hypothetical protein